MKEKITVIIMNLISIVTIWACVMAYKAAPEGLSTWKTLNVAYGEFYAAAISVFGLFITWLTAMVDMMIFFNRFITITNEDVAHIMWRAQNLP